MNRDIRAQLAPPLQSAFRIVVGFLFACHGAASLFGILGGAVGTHGGTVPTGSWPGWWAALIQLVGGALVAIGLFTRASALLCSGSMAYAYFIVHQPTGLFPIENNGEPASLYAWSFLLIFALGPGPWAVEHILGRSRGRESAQATEKAPLSA